MKQRIFGWISVLIGVVLALATVEVAAIAWLYVEDGRYTPAAELFERTQNTYVRDMTKGTGCRLHRHALSASLSWRSSSTPTRRAASPGSTMSACSVRTFPSSSAADHYVVMITGGSVASYLGGNQNAADPALSRGGAEQPNYVSPNGKPWMVLDGADGAWKEPQSFIIFSLYASSVDAMVNLSGFNEHYYFRAERWTSASKARPPTSWRSILLPPTRISATRRSAG